MDALIKKSPPLKGEVRVPPSKSYSQRAIALSLLVKKTHIKNFGKSDDEKVALNIIKECGAKIQFISESEFIIENNFDFNTDIQLSVGESGLSARLFSILMLLNQKTTTIIGKGSLIDRPLDTLFELYDKLGIKYEYKDGKFPIVINGKRFIDNITVDGSISSQYITGLLYYIVGLKADMSIKLHIDNPTSIPYIKMTIETLEYIGAKIRWLNNSTIVIEPTVLFEEVKINIEADWSSASFWIIAAAISGKITLKGLNANSIQADAVILEIVKIYGAEIEMAGDNITVTAMNHFKFDVDASHCPDLIPVLVLLAIFNEGESTIGGVGRLKFKESDRLNCIVEILNSLNISYDLLNNIIKIYGNKKGINMLLTIDNQSFNSNNDHRIAMASSILALYLIRSKVKGIHSVQKSYPEFYSDLKSLGGIFEFI